MIRHKLIIIALSALFAGVVYVPANAEYPGSGKHPVEVVEAVCSQCHPEKWHALDHMPSWGRLHRVAASQNATTCNVCHKDSYCADCHSVKDELKPSDKLKDSPGVYFPHRGDYLTQHRIDGKINPAPCFRCHGRRNNARCRSCHR